MASLVSRSNGLREIQFTDTDGIRKAVRLGKMSLKMPTCSHTGRTDASRKGTQLSAEAADDRVDEDDRPDAASAIGEGRID